MHNDALAAHQWLELAQLFVVHKQFLGQRTLVTQHVNQEAHGTQTVAQFLENPGARARLVNVVHHELLDTGAHAQGRERGLVQPQHREHAAHLRELRWHIAQRQFVLRIAEKRIEGFFHPGQRGTQFVHHAAHGLAVTHPAIELLHPAFHGLGLATAADMPQAHRQPRTAVGHLALRRVDIFVSGFQIQHGCRHFHGHGRRRGCAAFYGDIQRMGQGLRQIAAFRVQLHHRI